MTNQVHPDGLVRDSKPHFVLVPLFAQGHMIPMVDMARLLAERGAAVSLVTTPVNAARIKPVIDRVRDSGLAVRFVELAFPCAEVGIPDGCENLHLVTCYDHYIPFYRASEMLGAPLELYLREQELGATCMISDNNNYWTADIARALNIPRLVFHGPSCFYILCSHMICKHGVFDGAMDDSETAVVPGLPCRIEVTRAQAPGSWFKLPGWEDIGKKVEEAEATADGVVVNTFLELEREFVDIYRKEIGKPVLPIGPLSLCNKDAASKSTRGNKPAVDERRIMNWLDSMAPKSVLYLSFGSLIHTGLSQLIEIGSGLEASNRPFIWVIKNAGTTGTEFEEWVSEGFGERTKERGLIVDGWAPQMLILSHPSVGGFVTHCGWNSTLEAISAGVPMLTWPHVADQFLNEKLVVEVLRIGVAVGVKEPNFKLDGGDAMVKRNVLEKAVWSLMDGGEEGEERRERAREPGEKARLAMERGGSSYENLMLLTKSIMNHACTLGYN